MNKEEITERRKKAETENIKEGALLYHLISKDHRSLATIAKELGIEQTYLSAKKLRDVGILSSKVATAAIKFWGLSPDYFERYVNDEEIDKKEQLLQDTLSEINSKLDLVLLHLIKNPSNK